MAHLEAEHRSVWREVNRKTAIAVPQVFTISGCRSNGRFAHGGNFSGPPLFPGPRRSGWIPAKYPVLSEFTVRNGAHGVAHGAIVRRTEWLEQNLTITLQANRVGHRRVPLKQFPFP